MKTLVEKQIINEEQLRILKNCILSQRLTAMDLKVIVNAMDDVIADTYLEDEEFNTMEDEEDE